MKPWTPPDIAVINATSSKTVVGQGFTPAINVTAANQGNEVEAFDVTAYAKHACREFLDKLLSLESSLLRAKATRVAIKSMGRTRGGENSGIAGGGVVVVSRA
jgi:hypothetical protein